MSARQLTLAAGALFIVSYFLPAYAGAGGYECFRHCLSLLGDFSGRGSDAPLKWLYYSAFVPTNLLFVAALVTGLKTGRFFRTRLFATLAAFFHVFSWLVFNLTKEGLETFQLQAGYFVWLLSYALLLAAQIQENRIHPRTAS